VLADPFEKGVETLCDLGSSDQRTALIRPFDKIDRYYCLSDQQNDERRRRYVDIPRSKNLCAEGETMVGSILGHGNLAGCDMMIGTVFCRITGQMAAASRVGPSDPA